MYCFFVSIICRRDTYCMKINKMFYPRHNPKSLYTIVYTKISDTLEKKMENEINFNDTETLFEIVSFLY